MPSNTRLARIQFMSLLTLLLMAVSVFSLFVQLLRSLVVLSTQGKITHATAISLISVFLFLIIFEGAMLALDLEGLY
ncbi:hypothetical protein L596_021707 [Steinernema carpocapsae]|uniref:Uncharacterized protein n=1 Tax=Steinernema carpocapsae TaxID=34508 RepID=A0A4U5MJL6_STECR|nr:hypothetical protein L596_021707 [Steinernema carpocapsae]